MRDDQRQLLFGALLGDISMLPSRHPAREVLEQVALGQLNDLEPIIDRMLDEAAGKAKAA